MIKLYNTLSRKKEDLPDQTKIRLFVCGPTVYDYLHIGNARTYIFFDFFAKYLRSQGYDVEYLQNITDIDDKIIRRAAEENKKSDEVAKFFTEAYFEDMKSLGVNAVSKYAKATDFISQIVRQVERLIDKGFAYEIEGDGWYFDISKDADYGKLSGRTTEQAEDGVSRIDEAVGKKNKGDFCLWKFSKDNEPTWPSSLGVGRPGWHIEDTAISEFYFGPQYEIHGGGVDLKFPHHEAEIAQQESASGLKPFVKIWMHTGALLADGKKMSKSLGNFVTIRDFLKEHSPDVLRLITLTHSYESPINFSDELIKQAETTITNIKIFLAKLKIVANGTVQESGHLEKKAAFEADQKLWNIMEDDINCADAIAQLFKEISLLQPQTWDLLPKDALTRFNRFNRAFQLFGFAIELPEIPEKIRSLAMDRELSRSNKHFEQSDALRKQINDLGYEVEDTPRGPFLWPK